MQPTADERMSGWLSADGGHLRLLGEGMQPTTDELMEPITDERMVAVLQYSFV